jgi:hypothetical protein
MRSSRVSTVHHSHPILVGLGLFLGPLCVRNGFFLLSGASLHDAEDDHSGKEEDTATDCAGNNNGTSGFGKSVPVAGNSLG